MISRRWALFASSQLSIICVAHLSSPPPVWLDLSFESSLTTQFCPHSGPNSCPTTLSTSVSTPMRRSPPLGAHYRSLISLKRMFQAFQPAWSPSKYPTNRYPCPISRLAPGHHLSWGDEMNCHQDIRKTLIWPKLLYFDSILDSLDRCDGVGLRLPSGAVSLWTNTF